MGPGKPYWKRPEGSTAGTSSFSGRAEPGIGGEGDVRVGVFGVAVGIAEGLRSREEMNTEVAATPAAADKPATMAKVVLDMVNLMSCFER